MWLYDNVWRHRTIHDVVIWRSMTPDNDTWLYYTTLYDDETELYIITSLCDNVWGHLTNVSLAFLSWTQNGDDADDKVTSGKFFGVETENFLETSKNENFETTKMAGNRLTSTMTTRLIIFCIFRFPFCPSSSSTRSPRSWSAPGSLTGSQTIWRTNKVKLFLL